MMAIRLNIPIELQGVTYNIGDIISVKDYDQYYELKEILNTVENLEVYRVYSRQRKRENC